MKTRISLARCCCAGEPSIDCTSAGTEPYEPSITTIDLSDGRWSLLYDPNIFFHTVGGSSIQFWIHPSQVGSFFQGDFAHLSRAFRILDSSYIGDISFSTTMSIPFFNGAAQQGNYDVFMSQIGFGQHFPLGGFTPTVSAGQQFNQAGVGFLFPNGETIPVFSGPTLPPTWNATIGVRILAPGPLTVVQCFAAYNGIMATSQVHQVPLGANFFGSFVCPWKAGVNMTPLNQIQHGSVVEPYEASGWNISA